jgi:hypothetical protein
MAQGSTYKGKNLRIRIGAETVFHATECSFNSTMQLEGIASKDTNGTLQTPGNYEWGLSTNMLVADKATASTQHDFVALLTKHQAGELVTVSFTTDIAGDFVITGQAFIASINASAPTNGVATADASFTGNGDYVISAVV